MQFNQQIKPIPDIPTLICQSCIENLQISAKFCRNVKMQNEKYQQLLKLHLQIEDPLESEIITVKTEPIDETLQFMDEFEIKEELIELESDEKSQIECKDDEIDFNSFISPKNFNFENFLEPATSISSKKSRKESFKTFSCTKCNKKGTELEVQEHMMEHATMRNQKKRIRKLKPSPKALKEKSEWTCSYCEKCFASKFDMLLHRKREHQKE